LLLGEELGLDHFLLPFVDIAGMKEAALVA
jgi:hypothetical protein